MLKGMGRLSLPTAGDTSFEIFFSVSLGSLGRFVHSCGFRGARVFGTLYNGYIARQRYMITTKRVHVHAIAPQPVSHYIYTVHVMPI